MLYIQQGTLAFRKASLALFAGGFSTFAILYCIQPLMPEFTQEFHVSPTIASLSLSLTTLSMAITMLFVGSLSDALGRKVVMVSSLVGAALLAILVAVSPSYSFILVARILQGIVLAGLPAIAMTYISEEIEPASLGYAMGLYISGNAIGGMSGRMITGMVADLLDWRIAVAFIGVLSLLTACLFWYGLPSSRHFKKRNLNLTGVFQPLWAALTNVKLLYLYGLGFVMMGSFVTVYNYIGFELIAAPYDLSPTIVSWIFIVYLTGTVSSTWMGRLSDRMGRYTVMMLALLIMMVGAALSMSAVLVLKLLGIALFTFGFFGGHSIASSWIGVIVNEHRAQASALYLFFYYVGGSVSGTVGGLFFSHLDWNGVAGMVVCFMIVGFGLNRLLRKQDQSRGTM